MGGMRAAIAEARFPAFRDAVKEEWARGDLAPL
jgi:hypothetical protein